MTEQTHIPADAALAPYHDAAAEGRLLLKHCNDCDKTYYYPRPLCPFCLSDNTRWLEASGKASVYTWSVQRRAEPPYVIAYVTLAEGPVMMTALVDCDPDNIAIDQAVTLSFEQRDGQAVPVFKPA